MATVDITRIGNLNAVVIRQRGGQNFFISTRDSLIISVPNLAAIIKYMVRNNLLSRKVLEGILSELEE